ncbi:GNAT family N-acetyltransferase [uncultured Bosea sp.]|uniref:GNAT family N-acetyltransferase n=1 Tax=uncultured Bosea sp. TaxID=211457 RepID=UPI0025FD3489|nr:GNAT family N-acetyltransferase [uncultured Bosea sp.]
MDVVENPEQNRFELSLDGGTALVAYRRDGQRLVLVHTEVPEQFAGQGVGSRLAKGVFELLRASKRKAVVRCEFLKGWLAKHPEYEDVVDG